MLEPAATGIASHRDVVPRVVVWLIKEHTYFAKIVVVSSLLVLYYLRVFV